MVIVFEPEELVLTSYSKSPHVSADAEIPVPLTIALCGSVAAEPNIIHTARTHDKTFLFFTAHSP